MSSSLTIQHAPVALYPLTLINARHGITILKQPQVCAILEPTPPPRKPEKFEKDA